MNTKNKKIAFCLYGQVRYVKGLKKFYEYICDQDEYDIDIFIATWSDFDTRLLDLEFKDRAFFDHDEVTRTWEEGNTRKMSYLLHESLALKKKNEMLNHFKYDFVVPIRPDIVFKKGEFYDLLNSTSFDTQERPSVAIINDFKEVDGMKHVNADYLFIESSDAADVHSSIYNFFYLTERYKKTNIPYKEGGHWIHIFLFYYFNFNVEYRPIGSFMIRPERDLGLLIKLSDDPELIPTLAENKRRWEDAGAELLSDGQTTIKLKGRVI